MTAFTGVPLAALDFYEDLETDNTRAWWTAHKATYDGSVRAPMVALGAELEEEFGAPQLFRPHRDVRFSKDKSPYKTHQGLFVTVRDGIGFYVQVSAAGLMTAAGWHPRGEQVLRFREAVSSPAGAELDRLVTSLQAEGFTLDGDRLATRPRGTPPGHPREHLLRHKSLTMGRDWGGPGWLATPEAADRVRDDWRALRPLVEWLGDHVGPGDTS
ncbi:MAG: DUF2461 domain-containing protein [Actinomycetes bacterium]